MSIRDPILVYVSDLPMGFCTGRGEMGFLRVVGILSFGHVMQGEGDLVSWAFFRAPLMLQVVVTVLTHTHRRGDFQPLDL